MSIENHSAILKALVSDGWYVQYRYRDPSLKHNPWLLLITQQLPEISYERYEYRIVERLRIKKPCCEIEMPTTVKKHTHDATIREWIKSPSRKVLTEDSRYGGWMYVPFPTWAEHAKYKFEEEAPYIHAALMELWLDKPDTKFEQRPRPIDKASETQIHWSPTSCPLWYIDWEYRVAKDDTVWFMHLNHNEPVQFGRTELAYHNAKATFDPHTGALKTIEKLGK